MIQRIFENLIVGVVILFLIPIIFGVLSHLNKVSVQKKDKNPIIGFVLVLFLGPLGFLYYSWRMAVKVTLILIGLVILASVVFPAALPSWIKFVVLPILAIYSYKQIKQNNLKNDNKQKSKTEIDQVTNEANRIEALLRKNEIIASVVMVNKNDSYKEYVLEISNDMKMENIVNLNKLMADVLSVPINNIEVNLNSPSANLIGIKVKKMPKDELQQKTK